MTKSKIISFINMKGGVGKTTLCINVSDYLAKKDNKVLILDMDPQFNATQALLLEQQRRNRGENENNLDKESTDKKEDEAVKAEIDSSKYYKNLSTKGKTILQIFKSTNPNDDKKSIILHFTDNIDFIPGDLDLSSVVAGDTAGKVGAIKQYIYNNDLNEHYDYILIDCPPTWSILTHASLYASNYYIIPSKIDFYSSIGIKSLQEKIKEKLLDEFSYREVAQATGESIENLGVVFSMTTNLKAESSIKETVKKDIGKNIPIFDAEIPFIRSAVSSFIFYSEVEDNTIYANLTNSFDQFMTLLLDKIK